MLDWWGRPLAPGKIANKWFTAVYRSKGCEGTRLIPPHDKSAPRTETHRYLRSSLSAIYLSSPVGWLTTAETILAIMTSWYSHQRCC